MGACAFDGGLFLAYDFVRQADLGIYKRKRLRIVAIENNLKVPPR